MMRALRAAWERITEPRHMKVAYLAIYMLTVVIGVVTLISPPQSIAGEAGPLITTVWAMLFIVGGAIGAITVLPGWWWAERLLAIGPVMLGLAIYLTVVTILHLQSTDAGSSRLTQVGIILLASAPFTIRALVIREYSYEPRR
ncbi:hypothetical protein [Microbacterium sp. XT11]|uniref:hypothetical protein n=1 Tax=Microbacterium sp. XT11 TaxID=367477 RepID=UPI000743140E|nr:hypothetical protein [Microbacterium sp. XT11]ALX66835.1 hypothetical protein AB663_002290 [Microbacterium sp. XT11]